MSVVRWLHLSDFHFDSAMNGDTYYCSPLGNSAPGSSTGRASWRWKSASGAALRCT